MSVILPKDYKRIADKLGSAYAAVRDALMDAGADVDSSAFGYMKDAYDIITASVDNNIRGSGIPDGYTLADTVKTDEDYDAYIETSSFTAPEGSIGQDLNQVWSRLVFTTLKESQAKTTAANIFRPALQKLNSHVTSRMHNVSTISAYYSTYAFVEDATETGQLLNAADLSLFDLSAEAGLDASPTYFSAEFAELSSQIGVTIDSAYVTS